MIGAARTLPEFGFCRGAPPGKRRMMENVSLAYKLLRQDRGSLTSKYTCAIYPRSGEWIEVPGEALAVTYRAVNRAVRVHGPAALERAGEAAPPAKK